MRLLWKKSVSAVLTYFAPWSGRIARPPKPRRPPPPVADREHDPLAEAVVLAAAATALRQPHRAQLLDPEARPLATQQHRVPGARRVADRECATRLLLQAPLPPVGARLRRLLGLPEEVRVEGGGAIEQVAQAPPLLPPRLRPRVLLLALQLDPVAFGEHLAPLAEAEPLLFLDELDRVAPDPAAEAVVELF